MLYMDTWLTGTVVVAQTLVPPHPGPHIGTVVVTIIVFTWVRVSTPSRRMMSTPSAPDALRASVNGSGASLAAAGTTAQPGAPWTLRAWSLWVKTSSASRWLAGLKPTATTAIRAIGPPVKLGSNQADWRAVVWHPARTDVARSRDVRMESL